MCMRVQSMLPRAPVGALEGVKGMVSFRPRTKSVLLGTLGSCREVPRR